MHTPRCPICKKPSATRATNPAAPFCSPRCKTVDLGRWLGEEYRMPEGPADEREDEGDAAPARREPDA